MIIIVYCNAAILCSDSYLNIFNIQSKISTFKVYFIFIVSKDCVLDLISSPLESNEFVFRLVCPLRRIYTKRNWTDDFLWLNESFVENQSGCVDAESVFCCRGRLAWLEIFLWEYQSSHSYRSNFVDILIQIGSRRNFHPISKIHWSKCTWYRFCSANASVLESTHS